MLNLNLIHQHFQLIKIKFEIFKNIKSAFKYLK